MLGLGLAINKNKAVSGEFSPDQISNLELWLESDMGITLNGSNVAAWANQSSNRNNAVQATAVSQPAYVTNQLNGLPVLRFDGSNDSLNSIYNVGISGTQVRTMIAAVKPISIANPIAGWGGGSNGTAYSLVIGPTDEGVGYFGGRYGRLVTSSNWRIGTAIRPSVSTSITNTDIYINGSAIAGTITTGTEQTVNTTDSQLSIGRANSVSTSYVSADVAAILVYSKALSTQERQSVEQYLSNKYDIALS